MQKKRIYTVFEGKDHPGQPMPPGRGNTVIAGPVYDVDPASLADRDDIVVVVGDLVDDAELAMRLRDMADLLDAKN